MVTLDYKLMLSLSLWQYNHHPDEGLTSGLFQKTFGPVDGKHYYEKWTGYFNRNLWDMIAYFRGEGENGQKFCDMIAAQVELYTKNRKITVITGVLQYMNHIHLPGTVLRVFIPGMPLDTCFFRIQKIVISYPLNKRVFRQLRHRHEAAGRSQRRRINMEIHIPVLH